MSDSVSFEDYTIKVTAKINDKIEAVLEECAGELESAAKRNSRVDTGQTKNSFQHFVTHDGVDSVAYIGSDYMNAIYEEFGTGEYALKGGRKGGWWYKSDKDGQFYHTYGKSPSRAFYKAYTSLKNTVIQRIQNALSEI